MNVWLAGIPTIVFGGSGFGHQSRSHDRQRFCATASSRRAGMLGGQVVLVGPTSTAFPLSTVGEAVARSSDN